MSRQPTRRRATILLLACAMILFVAGIMELLRLRFARGDLYPVYSTYRADALGTRALYESLEITPGARVQRWLRPAEKLPGDFRGVIFFAGMSRRAWEKMPEKDAQRLDQLARDGARVVVAFTAGFEKREMNRWLKAREQRDSDDEPNVYDAFAQPPGMRAGEEPKAEEKEFKPAEKKGEKNKKDAGKKDETPRVDAGAQWGVKLDLQRVSPDKDGKLAAASRAAAVPAEWPGSISWLSELFFKAEASDGWRTLYTREGRAVLIERQIGAGSVVLASDSFFLSNEALHRERATALLAWLVNAPRGGGLVMFDENHLGMEDETGVAALARRYGLGGAACMAAILAALWIWRRMALFVPPVPDSENTEDGGCEPAAGLEAVLRRSVSASQIAAACVAEWRKTASASDIARVETALSALPAKATSAQTYNAALKALKKRHGVFRK